MNPTRRQFLASTLLGFLVGVAVEDEFFDRLNHQYIHLSILETLPLQVIIILLFLLVIVKWHVRLWLPRTTYWFK